jgi:tetratricopeptide (TPR) repeat protein
MIAVETEQQAMDHSKRPTPIVRDVDTLLKRGIEAVEYDRIDEALGVLRQAAQLAPESADVMLVFGIALMRGMEMQEALNVLESAVTLAPDSFYPRFRLGECYMRIGVPTRAREELRVAMDLSTTAEERRLVRKLLSIEDARSPKRIWRPDFLALVSRRKPRR